MTSTLLYNGTTLPWIAGEIVPAALKAYLKIDATVSIKVIGASTGEVVTETVIGQSYILIVEDSPIPPNATAISAPSLGVIDIPQFTHTPPQMQQPHNFVPQQEVQQQERSYGRVGQSRPHFSPIIRPSGRQRNVTADYDELAIEYKHCVLNEDGKPDVNGYGPSGVAIIHGHINYSTVVSAVERADGKRLQQECEFFVSSGRDFPKISKPSIGFSDDVTWKKYFIGTANKNRKLYIVISDQLYNQILTEREAELNLTMTEVRAKFSEEKKNLEEMKEMWKNRYLKMRHDHDKERDALATKLLQSNQENEQYKKAVDEAASIFECAICLEIRPIMQFCKRCFRFTCCTSCIKKLITKSCPKCRSIWNDDDILQSNLGSTFVHQLDELNIANVDLHNSDDEDDEIEDVQMLNNDNNVNVV